jgi:serine/threonine protein kinase
MKSLDEIEQAFRLFEARVRRLEQLRNELDALDTRGFEREAQSIRDKLKTPQVVVQTVKEMDSLKKAVEAKGFDAAATLAAQPPVPAQTAPSASLDQTTRPEPEVRREPGGELSAKYELIDSVGLGGFADVYKARRKEDGAIVAIKIPRLAQFETVEPNQFLQEARLWLQLDHPNIVRVFEYGTKPYPWIAVEYMEKGSLRSRMGHMTLEESLDVALKVCDALYYTHHLGVIHRDIKPENILCDRENNPKLADWGLGKMMIDLSMRTVASGTPYYSSPEQVSPARFGKVGWWTDIYQFGAVLYEMVTGQLPFKGESPLEVAVCITEGEITRPCEIRPELPAEFDDLIVRCLARDKDQRYKDISMVIAALESIRSSLK